MNPIYKLPLTKDNYYIDFVNLLGGGEALQGTPTVTAFDQNIEADATNEFISESPAPAINSTQVVFWYQAGQVDHNYLVSVSIGTTAGRTLEGAVIFQVVASN